MDILVEKQIQEHWKKDQSNIATVDTQRKCFVTFPFPYQNGTLHLGHAYTISKVEFYARYKKISGFNVLFPYGFHGTGMPIVASAAKLEETLDAKQITDLPVGNQLRILRQMNISDDEIPAFINPQTWLHYFPKRSIDDLERFGAHIDFRRSFITTSVNPHYDCFVKWQFENLYKKGYLKFEKGPVIYSPKDKQICGDHDRSTGEYVGITKSNVHFVHHGNYTLMITPTLDLTEQLYTFDYDGQRYVSTETFLANFKYQTDKGISNIEMIYDVLPAIDFANPQFNYYEPSDIVISRTGEKCVVAITDYWYIDYSAPGLKERVCDYVTSDFFRTTNDRQIFVDALNKLQKHVCSKTGNIPGTKLLDTDYVIDSLSDSTIYMAYYTIAHRVTELPVDMLREHYFDIYEFVFKEGVMPLIGYDALLRDMKVEFTYWYPVDLRVSGEDLVGNHLAMCLHNHAMIWDGDENMPTRFAVNGYITLDGKRMSKSEGTFMTLSDALDKYGADVTRLALAMAGSGMNDADFSERNIQLAIQRLVDGKKWCMGAIDELISREIGIDNTQVDADVAICVREIERYYDEMDYQQVVETIFGKLLVIGNRVYRIVVDRFLLMLYPICPHFVEQMWMYGAELHFSKTLLI